MVERLLLFLETIPSCRRGTNYDFKECHKRSKPFVAFLINKVSRLICNNFPLSPSTMGVLENTTGVLEIPRDGMKQMFIF